MPRVGVTTCAVRSTARAGRRPALQAGSAITAGTPADLDGPGARGLVRRIMAIP